MQPAAGKRDADLILGASSNEADDQGIRIAIGRDIRIQTRDGRPVQVRSRKGRALLSLIALSDEREILRERAASILWSSLERRAALARLRDLIHNLNREFNDAGVITPELRGLKLSLPRECVSVDVDLRGSDHAYGDRTSLLSELDDVDPALDRWLIHLRGEVRQSGEAPRPSDMKTAAREADLGQSFGPRVLITEFDMVGSELDDVFVRVLADEIGRTLSRTRWITVILNTEPQRAQAGIGATPKTAHYILSGAVQRCSTRFRLSLQLSHSASSGEIVWSTTLEEEDESGFAVQRTFADSVTGRLESELLLIEAGWRRPPARSRAPDAYSLVLSAIPSIYRLEHDSFLAAGHALVEAVSRDRNFAMAHLWQAYWNIFLVGQGWAKNPHQAIREAGRAAERAMVLDPKDARGLTVAGHVRAFLDKRLNEAMALHEQALQLNATLPLAWHFFGMAYAYAGRIDEAQSHFLRALKLAPEAPFAFLPQSGLAIVHLLRGEHEACVLASRRVTERYQNFSAAYKFYLAALGHLGEKEEAGLVLQRLRLREPSFSLRTLIRGMPYKREQDLQHIVVGLRRAGLT